MRGVHARLEARGDQAMPVSDLRAGNSGSVGRAGKAPRRW